MWVNRQARSRSQADAGRPVPLLRFSVSKFFDFALGLPWSELAGASFARELLGYRGQVDLSSGSLRSGPDPPWPRSAGNGARSTGDVHRGKLL